MPGALACGETPVAVRVTLLPAALLGIAICACNSTRWPADKPPTWHVDLPAGWHTVKVGDRLLGRAVRRTVALPFVPAVSHTHTAY
jgi:hypothetical protein